MFPGRRVHWILPVRALLERDYGSSFRSWLGNMVKILGRQVGDLPYYALLLTMTLVDVCAQDSRRVSEPRIPPSCTILTASLTAHGTTLAEADESKLDTRRVQNALDHCPPRPTGCLQSRPHN